MLNGYVIRVLILISCILPNLMNGDPCPNFNFMYFTKFDECQATVQRVITSQKSKKKQADFRV